MNTFKVIAGSYCVFASAFAGLFALVSFHEASLAYSIGFLLCGVCLLAGSVVLISRRNVRFSFITSVVVTALIMGGILGAARMHWVLSHRIPIMSCVNYLRQIDGAKDQWAIETNAKTGSTPTWEDVLPYLKEKPICHAGGTYSLGKIGEYPKCSIGGPKHELR